ncbi:hypothetical protein [Neorhizobium galegae]|uniref:hypothetical protein n=1 Tax=Neorhizobium galegae TaxID=399 RepID=UPI000627EBB7|nr:hypothetical protein [Neorhizobium galegae]KAB1126763.1 hypothetical protein F4V90_06650 [Neorhizobium galegae]
MRVFYVLAVGCGIVLSYCLFQLVEIVFAGREGLAPLTRAVILIPLVVGCSSFAIFCVPRMNLQKAVLIISPDGIWMPATMPQVLPWTVVSQITLFGEYGSPKNIAVISRGSLDPETRSQVTKASHGGSVPQSLVISPALLGNIKTDDLLALMKRYHKKFGSTPDEDSGPPGPTHFSFLVVDRYRGVS